MKRKDCNTQSPSPAERLPSLDRSSRVLSYSYIPTIMHYINKGGCSLWPTWGFFSPDPWIIYKALSGSLLMTSAMRRTWMHVAIAHQTKRLKVQRTKSPIQTRKSMMANKCMYALHCTHQQPSWPTTMTVIGNTHSKSKEQMLTYLWVIVRKGCLN